MSRIGVAIIGCGYWGANYVRVFNELPQSRVAVVCDRRAERLREIGQRFPGVELATGMDEVLGRDDVDVAVVCTPATTHHDVARLCLAAGKHVLVEKPLTTTAADAVELIGLAESRNLTLMVGHTFIYNAGIQRVKAYVAQGNLGRVYYLYSCRTNLGPIRQDVNAVWDLAPHDVAIFNHLLERTPEWVSAVGARVLQNHREDVGFVSLGYSEDVVGHVHVSWADPNKVRQVVVVGSDKRIVFDDLNALECVRVFEKGITSVPAQTASYGERHFLLRDGDIVSPRVEASEPLKNQCGHFLECVTRGSRPLSGGPEGLEVVRVMEAIGRSVELRGAPVEVGQGVAR